MKDLTSVTLMIGAVVGAPFLIDGMHEFLGKDEVDWIPYFLTTFVAVMLFLLPVLRPIGTGLIIGTLVFGGVLAFQPSWLTWMPRSVDPAAPF